MDLQLLFLYSLTLSAFLIFVVLIYYTRRPSSDMKHYWKLANDLSGHFLLPKVKRPLFEAQEIYLNAQYNDYPFILTFHFYNKKISMLSLELKLNEATSANFFTMGKNPGTIIYGKIIITGDSIIDEVNIAAYRPKLVLSLLEDNEVQNLIRNFIKSDWGINVRGKKVTLSSGEVEAKSTPNSIKITLEALIELSEKLSPTYVHKTINQKNQDQKEEGHIKIARKKISIYEGLKYFSAIIGVTALSVFILWQTLIADALCSIQLKKSGIASIATAIEREQNTSAWYDHKYTHKIVFDGLYSNAYTQTPFKIGQQFEILYVPNNPDLYEFNVSRRDSALKIFKGRLNNALLFLKIFISLIFITFPIVTISLIISALRSKYVTLN